VARNVSANLYMVYRSNVKTLGDARWTVVEKRARVERMKFLNESITFVP
jgi:hypothetical protein